MFKIGIIGADNSHALAFSKLANIPDVHTGEYAFPDTRITGIFGIDTQQAEAVAKEGQLEFVAERPEDFLGKVDGIMVVCRHGDLHAPYALPFVEAGIPTWIDKPVTIKISDAKQLIDAADKHQTLLTGGSTCKYAYDVLMLKHAAENEASTGRVLSGALNFPANLDSEYGGLFFYGPHMAEMLLTIFGYDVQSVVTSVNHGNVIAVARYDRYDIALHFTTESTQYYGLVYGEKKTVVREIDISIIYKLGFAKFVDMLRTRTRPLPLEHLLIPTVLLNAIITSMETGREVYLRELLS